MADVPNRKGFAATCARQTVQQDQHKPLLGKATIKYGQCFARSTLYFSMGATIAIKFADNLDVAGHMLLGITGQPGAFVKLTELRKDFIANCVENAETMYDFAVESEQKRFSFEGNSYEFMKKYGLMKLETHKASDLLWQYAELGFCLGIAFPEQASEFVADKEHDPEEWKKFHEAGLDIPKAQDVISYSEFESAMVADFLEYGKVVAPALYSQLI